MYRVYGLGENLYELPLEVAANGKVGGGAGNHWLPALLFSADG